MWPPAGIPADDGERISVAGGGARDDNSCMSMIEPHAVENHPLFSGMGREAARALLAAACVLRYQIGDAVFDQGADAHSFFVLLEGRLRVTRVTPGGQQVVIRFVSPGDVFGIAAAIGRTTYPATAAALVPSSALAWPNASWPRLVAEHPALASQTLLAVGSRLQDAHARVVALSTTEVEARLADAILKLAQEAGRETDGAIAVDFPITRQDLAELTGTTMHTVSRILSAWQERGIIRSSRKKLAIVEPHALAALRQDG